MALGRLDVPGPRPLQRHDLPGHVQGRPERHGRHGLRGHRRVSGGQDHARRAVRDRERRRAPVPARAAASTPPTRCATVMEFIGLSPAGLNGDPGRGPGQGRGGAPDRRARDGPRPPRCPAVDLRHARVARERHRLGGRDRRLDQRRAAPAGDRPRVRDPARHRRFRRRSPIARRSSPTCSRAAATPRPTCTTRAAWAWSCASCSSATACSTATRPPSTAGRSRRSPRTRSETEGQQVVLPIETPLKPTGGLAILRGSLAPDGCVVKLAGHERAPPPRPGTRVRLRDGLLRGGQGPPDRPRRRRRDPLRRAGRRPGHAGDAERDRRAGRRGPRRHGRADHRRPLLGRHARPDDRPHRARGGARRTDRGSSRRATRSSSTSTARRSTWTSIPTRSRAGWPPGRRRPPNYAAACWRSTRRWSGRPRRAR